MTAQKTRKPLSLWFFVSMFVVATSAMPLLFRSPHPSMSPPRTLTELRQLLAQVAPELYVVPVRPDDLERGTYICAHAQPREQLMNLMRNSQVAGQWQGVVFCEKEGNVSVIPEHEKQSWGEYGMRIGPLLFFGDPALLRRIHKAISDRQGGKRDSGIGSDRDRSIFDLDPTFVEPTLHEARPTKLTRVPRKL